MIAMVLAAVTATWAARPARDDTLGAELAVAQSAERARASSNALRRFAEDTFLNVRDVAKESQYEGRWHEQHAQLLDRLADVDRYATEESDRTAASEMRTILGRYDVGFAAVVTKIRGAELTSPEACDAQMAAYEDDMQHLETVAADLAAQHYAAAQAASVVAGSRLQRSLTAMAALVAVSVVVGIGVGALLFAAVSRRLRDSASLARGGARSPAPDGGELAGLAAAREGRREGRREARQEDPAGTPTSTRTRTGPKTFHVN
jgi:hypothetical protein